MHRSAAREALTKLRYGELDSGLGIAPMPMAVALSLLRWLVPA